MKKLIEVLKEFESQIKGISNEDDLQNLFKKSLAPTFLYGGYIKVRDDFKIYIRTAEFYFHSEKENGIHDPIVYHRNGRGMKNVPYFPLMTLHSHDSGFDITFESKKNEYRASILIRSYEVVDNNGRYLEWNKKDMFEEHPTYKRKLLNGFSICDDNEIRWIDESRKQTITISEKARERVYQYDSNGNKVKCNRRWSFTRKDTV